VRSTVLTGGVCELLHCSVDVCALCDSTGGTVLYAYECKSMNE
jgi:hypothetical protein